MSWNRICWARAFSSDMWFTPKNWLSPNRSRSIRAGASGDHTRRSNGADLADQISSDFTHLSSPLVVPAVRVDPA